MDPKKGAKSDDGKFSMGFLDQITPGGQEVKVSNWTFFQIGIILTRYAKSPPITTATWMKKIMKMLWIVRIISFSNKTTKNINGG